MNQHQDIDLLIAKLEAGTINEKEYGRLVAWYNSFDDRKVVLPTDQNDDPKQLKERMHQKLFETIHRENIRPNRFVKVRKWLPYVAAALMVVVTSVWLFRNHRLGLTDLQTHQAGFVQDIPPGSNRATLTLASGQTVHLKEDEGGIVVGEELSYEDGSAVYEANESALENTYYELSTPRGGTYKVSLPDGTVVWLNAASSLKYPGRFAENERVVEVSGEAYFSVAPAANKPFKVVHAEQTISVLGTEFNLTAYADDEGIKTTLMNGSIAVKSTVNDQPPTVLHPGQQAYLKQGVIGVQAVNPALYGAWKDGVFYFEDTPFDEMMRQIARWYDVDIRYNNGIPKESFSGKLRRSVTLLGVLAMLRTSDINAVLKENTIVIN